MRAITYIAALSLLAIGGCSQMGSNESVGQSPPLPFNNGLRTSHAQPTSCSPADQTCGTGIGNPSIQSPVQKRLLNTTP